MQHDQGHSITESMSFGGISGDLLTLSCLCAVVSSAALVTWWLARDPAERNASGHPEAA
jgi:hypothetical protein